MNDFYVHSAKREEDSSEQLLIDHLSHTAKLAAHFAQPFGAEEYAFLAGYLYDFGKFSQEFQNRIKRQGPKCDHATAGSRILYQTCPKPHNKILVYCVAGHHCGLQNHGSTVDCGQEGTLMSRMSVEYVIPDAQAGLAIMDQDRMKVTKVPALQSYQEDKYNSFIFCFFKVWEREYDQTKEEGVGMHLVTGQKAPIARLHPSIKGIYGRKPMDMHRENKIAGGK